MKPAFSVLFFTVTSGIGYGLLLWVLGYNVTASLVSSTGLSLTFSFISIGVGLVFATLGLLSSTLHLANPKNAWRAFSRFRTSWLSREGVFALIFYPVVGAYLLLVYLNANHFLVILFAVLSMLIALATVVCTGMIYASLKPIRQWHHPLVTPLYVLFSVLSGFAALMALGELLGTPAFADHSGAFYCALTLFVTATKLAYLKSIGKPQGLQINQATGFSQAQVKLLDAGHNADTFLSKEFVFKVAAERILCLRYLSLLLVCVIPILCLIAMWAQAGGVLWLLVFISVYVGLLVERWLFFAEARHVVRLYHGDQSV